MSDKLGHATLPLAQHRAALEAGDRVECAVPLIYKPLIGKASAAGEVHLALTWEAKHNKQAGSPRDELPRRRADVSEWYYVDDLQVEQGPFAQHEVLQWHMAGDLPESLSMRRADGSVYLPLSAHVAPGGALEEPLAAFQQQSMAGKSRS